MGCAPSEDSDQPGHPPSLIRVFAVRIKKAWVLSYPLSAKRRLIRLGACPGWSESSLGAHAILLVLSWGGPYFHSLNYCLIVGWLTINSLRNFSPVTGSSGIPTHGLKFRETKSYAFPFLSVKCLEPFAVKITSSILPVLSLSSSAW